MKKTETKSASRVITHVPNHVVPNQLQAYMQSNTVPGIKPQQEVITTCNYAMSK